MGYLWSKTAKTQGNAAIRRAKRAGKFLEYLVSKSNRTIGNHQPCFLKKTPRPQRKTLIDSKKRPRLAGCHHRKGGSEKTQKIKRGGFADMNHRSPVFFVTTMYHMNPFPRGNYVTERGKRNPAFEESFFPRTGRPEPGQARHPFPPAHNRISPNIG